MKCNTSKIMVLFVLVAYWTFYIIFQQYTTYDFFKSGVNSSASSASDEILKKIKQRISQRQAEAVHHRPNLKTYLTTPANCSISHSIFGGRLGNFMFMIASLYGISRSNKCLPYLQGDYHHEKYFANFLIERKNTQSLLKDGGRMWQGKGETPDEFAIFMPWLMALNMTNDRFIFLLKGYVQSWKYFDQYRNEIKTLFLFKEQVYQSVLQSVKSLLDKYGLTFAAKAHLQATLVGIHLRRGDMLKDEMKNFGHTPASDVYFQRAVAEIEKKYTFPIFLVASEEISYCKKLFKGKNFLYLEGNSEAVDMALLSLMDVLILSVGTYGWWGAYLSDAHQVYYYRDWPIPGSQMSKLIKKDDFFMPTWVSAE